MANNISLRWFPEDDPIYKEGWSVSIGHKSISGPKTPPSDTRPVPSRSVEPTSGVPVINVKLLVRLINDVGVNKAVECWLNEGEQIVEDVVAAFVEKKTAQRILRTAGLKGRQTQDDAIREATALVIRLVDAEGRPRNAGHDRLLRALLLHAAEADGGVRLTRALVSYSESVVLHWTWDSGGMACNGTNEVKGVAGKYWFHNAELGYVSAPYRDLADAISHDENLVVNETTQRIEAPSLTPEKLAKILRVDGETPVGHTVNLNGKVWRVGQRGSLVRYERSARSISTRPRDVEDDR